MKPILFNTEMVQAILDGRKSVTRRICKDANERTVPLNEFIDNEKRTYAIQSYADIEHNNPVSLCEVKMPICVGEILYIRETWNHNPLNEYGNEIEKYVYKATYDGHAGEFGWHPSLHMPKEAARIFLKVTNVRVERLKAITEEQVWKEGISSDCEKCNDYKSDECRECANQHEAYFYFSDLWDSTVKKSDLDRYGWEANPWVWVIEFDRISKEEAYAEKN